MLEARNTAGARLENVKQRLIKREHKSYVKVSCPIAGQEYC